MNFNSLVNRRSQLLAGQLCWAVFVGSILYACSTSQNQETAFEIQEGIPQVIDFNFDIKPIISDRCFKCHGPDPNTREADLAFHTKELAFAALGENKDHFAIVPGDTAESTLVQRILTSDAGDIMPPPESNLTLTEREKTLLVKWIEQGAEWKPHWAFIPPKEVQIPTVNEEDWTQNEIDYFILNKLEEKSLNPSRQTSKEKLLRRVSFDLTGLPPTISELDSFLKDDSPNAFEKQVDRLLASPAYGERMAIDWMELARYADTHGYQDDFERVMWPWRDWVIHAFNKNQPYDEFVKWQLAGDLMPKANLEMIMATAFNRNHKITAEGGVIPEEYRTEYVADRGQTVSTAFMGLTMECSRCHDHKYDPITQKDYFSMFAFFNNLDEDGLIEMQEVAAKPNIKITKKDIAGILSFINNRNNEEEIPLMVMQDMKQPRKTFILNRGIYDQPLDEVGPATPEFVLPFDAKFRRDRLGLAEWLFDQDNPLTARVAVNRLWQQLFGQGIVATPYDFGNQGALPTHPELLDFLALKYQREGWNTKQMLKYMIMSATYQQTSDTNPKLTNQDPENRFLARASRLRLSAEMLRDQALQVGGLLNNEIGGPSVKPYQPEGLWKETTGGGGGSTARYEIDTGNLVYRKSLYTFWKRTVPPPNMMTFDAASRDLCTVKRQQTSTPLQALVLLNDPQFLEASRSLAQQAVEDRQSLDERISYMFQHATSRLPTEKEIDVLSTYFEEQKSSYSAEPERANEYLQIGRNPIPISIDSVELAAYAIVAHAILNLDEAITRG